MIGAIKDIGGYAIKKEGNAIEHNDIIVIPQYYDWWFDNALEFLGYLLESNLKVDVKWSEGISFNPLNDDEIDRLVDEIDRLIEFKLKYEKRDNEGIIEKKKRTYLPIFHDGKLVNFLVKDKKTKIEILKLLLSSCSIEDKKGKKICDICSKEYVGKHEISQVSQAVYPTVSGTLKSQCGIRRMVADYSCCPLCAFIGTIEWLDDIPFACDFDPKTLTHYLLFPKIEDISELHKFKKVLRGELTQKTYSNIISIKMVNNLEKEVYAKDEYSLLLSLFEKLHSEVANIRDYEDVFVDDWIYLRLKDGLTYTEEIKIPKIKSLEKIFKELKTPYSNFIDKSFVKPLKKEGSSDKISKKLNKENKYLMSKGIIMNDFKTFAKAFQIRENFSLIADKDYLDNLIRLWKT